MPFSAFYEPAGPDTFVATPATAGPWDARSQHAGPPSALVARLFERHEPVEGQRLARVAVDILRPVPVAPLTVRLRTVRPGKRITLIEAVVEAAGQEVLYARGWRLAGSPVPEVPEMSVVPGESGDDVGVPDLPPERDQPAWTGAHLDGYLAAMEWRFVDGGFLEPGPARVWMRPRLPLVADEVTSPASHALLVADSGNGVSALLDPADWLFVNVDLTVALHRPPIGEWVLLDARTTIDEGVGVTTSRLSDRRGPVGRGMQTLLVTAR